MDQIKHPVTNENGYFYSELEQKIIHALVSIYRDCDGSDSE